MQPLFQTNGIAWKLLRDNPDRYIYEPVRQGVDIPLPEDIKAGINDVSKRDGWNKPATSNHALPTETWREHIARRNRCLELRQKLVDGEINSINDLITYNLNIRQLAQDVIENCYDPELVWAFYQAITKITILDPTCGSGAFLFSALNILEPLYEACLEQMQNFLDEGFVPQTESAVQALRNFHQIIEQANFHQNRNYFIIKCIVINNLYGIDIMQEATEICKLRLFLKLASQVEPDISKPNNGIEPLPDIDFNIRAGNTLVGFTSLDEVKDVIAKESDGQIKLIYDSSIVERIEKKAQVVDCTFQDFHDLQIAAQIDSKKLSSKKAALWASINKLREELDCYLADEYEMGLSKKTAALKSWKESHQAFHWFAEFYRIIKQGGFDVIIGNPPYVEYKDVRTTYRVLNYRTEACGNLFAYVLERCAVLGKLSSRIGMIIPISAFSTDRMAPFILHEKTVSSSIHIANFSWRPGKLFEGVNLQLSILLQTLGSSFPETKTTNYILWDSDSRPELFCKLNYITVADERLKGSIPKMGTFEANSILEKIRSKGYEIGQCFTNCSNNKVYYRRGGLYWKVFIDFETGSSEEKIIYLLPEIEKYTIIAALSSSLWFWYFTITSDCRHLGNRDINTFPFHPNNMTASLHGKLNRLGEKYVQDIKRNAEKKIRVYKQTKSVECLSFRIKESKFIINEIDCILAQHYGLTDKELDFIINYDIKYRIGRDSGDESDNE